MASGAIPVSQARGGTTARCPSVEEVSHAISSNYGILQSFCPGVECQSSASKGEDYAGRVSTTASGLTCKPWSSTKYASLGDHSFCRNPSAYTKGIWCYTTDPSKKWELCDVPRCEEGGETCILAESFIIQIHSSLLNIQAEAPVLCWAPSGRTSWISAPVSATS